MKTLHWKIRLSLLIACGSFAGVIGCTKTNDATTGGGGTAKSTPVFSLAWSEYPSWSVFGVAHELGLLDQDQGKMGDIEKKWNVDIVLNQADYDTCIQMYGSGNADAVCITNMDILGPSATKPSTVLFPTSTSAGADACIAVGVENLEGLKGKTSFGLEKSVSQYCFERVLEKKGLNVADYPFSNMGPDVAAQQLQQGSDQVQSIVVWNPFVMETLRLQSKAKVMFDSSEIPEEIVDMVVASNEAMAKPGASDFANALMDAFYEVSRRIEDPATADATLVALGEKFSKLDATAMKTVVTQTKFYSTPQSALDLLSGSKFQSETMPAVAKFCIDHDIIEMGDAKEVSMGFDAKDKQLNFSSEFVKSYATKTTK